MSNNTNIIDELRKGNKSTSFYIEHRIKIPPGGITTISNEYNYKQKDELAKQNAQSLLKSLEYNESLLKKSEKIAETPDGNPISKSSKSKDVTTPETTKNASSEVPSDDPITFAGSYEEEGDYADSGTLSSNATTKEVYKNPNTSVTKYSVNTKKELWISLEAIPIYKLTQNVRAQSAYAEEGKKSGPQTSLAITMKNAKRYKFEFLHPDELPETLTHDWQPYESVAQSISQAWAQFGIGTPEQLVTLANALNIQTTNRQLSEIWSEVVEKAGNVWKGVTTGETGIGDIVTQGLNKIKNITKSGYVANSRVDSPLQYKGSNRRNFNFIFNLVNIDPDTNHEEVVLPVKLLQMLSSPSYEEQADAGFNVEIILPYVFEIKTKPGNLIVCDMAILKQVSPIWKGPWFNGYPSRCELTLQFEEYRPLEQSVFYGKSEMIIKSVQKDRAKNFKNQGSSSEQTTNDKTTSNGISYNKEYYDSGGTSKWNAPTWQGK